MTIYRFFRDGYVEAHKVCAADEFCLSFMVLTGKQSALVKRYVITNAI